MTVNEKLPEAGEAPGAVKGARVHVGGVLKWTLAGLAGAGLVFGADHYLDNRPPSSVTTEKGGSGAGALPSDKNRGEGSARMPEDIRKRIVDSPAIRTAVADALGTSPDQITVDTAHSTQTGPNGTVSWFSGDLSRQLGVAFGERTATVNGKTIDTLDSFRALAGGGLLAPIEVPGSDAAFFDAQQGMTTAFGSPNQNYSLAVQLANRDPNRVAGTGGFIGPAANAQTTTTNIAGMIIRTYHG